MYKYQQTRTTKNGQSRQHTYGKFPVYNEAGVRTSVTLPAPVYDLLVQELGLEKLKKLVMKFGHETPVGERSKHVLRRLVELLRESLDTSKLSSLVSKIVDQV